MKFLKFETNRKLSIFYNDQKYINRSITPFFLSQSHSRRIDHHTKEASKYVNCNLTFYEALTAVRFIRKAIFSILFDCWIVEKANIIYLSFYNFLSSSIIRKRTTTQFLNMALYEMC